MEMSVSLPISRGDGPVEVSLPGEGGEAAALLALTRGMRAGAEGDWARFAEGYFDRLFRFLLVLNRGDGEAARDQLQETLLRVARQGKVFDREEVFWGWLARVARSAHVDACRRQGRYLAFLRRFFLEPTGEEAGLAAEADPLPGLLAAGVACLPEEERALIAQKYFENRPVREIAAAAGCTEKAIESRLTRCRAKLREMLRKELRDETRD